MAPNRLVWVISRDAITVTTPEGQTHVIPRLHIHYDAILEHLKNNDIDSVLPLIVPVKLSIVNDMDGMLEIKGDTILFDGKPLRLKFISRMVRMLKDGIDISPLANFLRNLLENPSKSAVEELWDFDEANELPITRDGYVIAYKMVREDFLDLYTGTMDNSPGKLVQMRRNEVNDNREETCSQGLHFAALEYVVNGGYGSRENGNRLVAVKINPRDVVSIPTDYHQSKGRACQYTILREMDWDERLPITQVGFRYYDEAADSAEAEEDEATTLVPDGGGNYVPKGSKYTVEQVREVKRLLATVKNLHKIADATGMSRRHIARIRDGKIGATVSTD